MKIKNIVFDFGGVLVDWNPRYLYKDLFNDPEEMEEFLPLFVLKAGILSRMQDVLLKMEQSYFWISFRSIAR